MFDGSGEHYLQVGLSALDVIKAALQGAPTPRTILDLPCGFGRVTRVLRAQYPAAAITVCDLDRAGVDFASATFRARGVYSKPNFRDLQLDGPFDLIWVGSLLTHLPEHQTRQFLDFAARHMGPDSRLVVTSHGEYVADRLRSWNYGLGEQAARGLITQYLTHGYGYRGYDGSPDYGISLAARVWYETQLAGSCLRLQSYQERGWDQHQDVLVIRRASPSQLRGRAAAPLDRPGIPLPLPGAEQEAQDEAGSLGFDAAWYAGNYPDVVAAVKAGACPSLLAHYLADGWKEGRLPFDPARSYPNRTASVPDAWFAEADDGAGAQPASEPPAFCQAGLEGASAAGDEIRQPIFTAQLRRDRRRLAHAQEEIASLRAEIHRLESAPAHRAYRKLQQTYRTLPPTVRKVIWRLRSGTPSAGTTASELSSAPRGRAIVIDDHWPQPDRDAGSVDIVHLVETLGHLGFDVVLAAALEHDGDWLARDALIRAGIRCLLPSDAASVEDFLAREGATLDLCVLCRVYSGGRFLEPALQHARKARIVFNTIDLNFLRVQRQAQLEGTEAALGIAREVQRREEEVMRASDATIVVSRAELSLLRETMPELLVVDLPLARPLAPPVTSFAGRSGIGFIGGFAHAPNVDAMRYFLKEIWPLVIRDMPELGMTIVGPDFPAHLLDGVPGQVRALGHVPDTAPWFEGLRLTVAPLRFGAGAKGKVASSLAAGVPCIATAIAAEGMLLSENAGVLVENEPAAFAARLRDAYVDEALWNRLSAGGLAYAADTLSPSRWRDRLDALLRQIGL